MSPAVAAARRLARERHAEAPVSEEVALLVRAIEGEMLPRRAPVQAVGPVAGELDGFVANLLAAGDGGWAAQVAALRERGVAVESIYLDLLAPAARRLGEMWEDDRVMFSDVTVGLGRLHRIMRGLSSALVHDLPVSAESRRVLLLPAPGEQHTFGLSLVAEFFRRAGWEVVCELDGRAVDPVRRVRREWFDAVGISIGVDSRLEWLRNGITTIRRASRNRTLAVLVGGPVFALHPERAADVGADACVPDAREAPSLAATLVETKAGRR